jgi:hypothetical protein
VVSAIEDARGTNQEMIGTRRGRERQRSVSLIRVRLKEDPKDKNN